MGCHLFSIMINGLLPLQWPDQGVFTSSMLWLSGFTPSVGLYIGLNMGFTPSVGLNMSFTSSVVYPFGLYPIRSLFEGFYPHMWSVWRALSPSVVCLKSFTPTVFWVHLQGCYQMKIIERLYCDVGPLPFWTCPTLSRQSYHYTIL